MTVERSYRICRGPEHAGPRWVRAVDFHVKVWGDESKTWPAQLQSWCRACQNRAARERKAIKEGRSVELVTARKGRMGVEESRRRSRERYAEMIGGDERRKRLRERSREEAAIRRRKAGIAVRGGYSVREPVQEKVRVRPLKEWLAPLWNQLDERTVKTLDVIDDDGTILITTVDRILTKVGRPDVFRGLYGSGEDE